MKWRETLDNIILSVIVPVYNVSEYIDACVNSIIEQSYDNNIEIILIDDGSTDGSGELCDELAAIIIKSIIRM